MNILSTDKAPGAIGPYSQGYEVNGGVYTSGQIPVDPADGTVAEGIAAQAEQSCKNVGAILEAAGTGDVYKRQDLPMPKFDRVAPAEPVKDIKHAKIAVAVSYTHLHSQYYGTAVWFLLVGLQPQTL